MRVGEGWREGEGEREGRGEGGCVPFVRAALPASFGERDFRFCCCCCFVIDGGFGVAMVVFVGRCFSCISGF